MTDLELEQCIAEYGADIYSFCCCLTGSRQEADDLYQETFLRAVEKQKVLDAEENPKSYLPDKMKVTVLLFYMEERSVEQIAGILHIPRGTVKSRLHQARRILKRELEYMLNE